MGARTFANQLTLLIGPCLHAKLRRFVPIVLLMWLVPAATAVAGHQIYEPLSDNVRTMLETAVADAPVTDAPVLATPDGRRWVAEMSLRLVGRIPDNQQRRDFLATVYYEAVRAGLDPSLVMGVIEVESGFHKYAISSANARGYMQVMPFWVSQIGSPGQDLFHLRTNLRYGCNILRLYLDQENGDLFRALGRYNGSLGQADYPRMVVSAWKRHWTLGTSTSAR